MSYTFPETRTNEYEDNVWDEETGLWIDNDNRAGGRYKSIVVVINDQGEIYHSGDT